MEPSLSSEDSCDSEKRVMKIQLSEFGLEEDNLCKAEMTDLLNALRNSESSVKEEESTKETLLTKECPTPTKNKLNRKYLNVRDRRMPWCILPGTLSQAEKARTLAVYLKLMSLNTYHQAKQSTNFATWPPPIQIVEELRIQPLRSTRSGRSVPIYADYDDDSSDMDYAISKIKKRKVSISEPNISDGVYTNKVISLKRKTLKDENIRPFKEAKVSTENETIVDNIKGKRDSFTIVED